MLHLAVHHRAVCALLLLAYPWAWLSAAHPVAPEPRSPESRLEAFFGDPSGPAAFPRRHGHRSSSGVPEGQGAPDLAQPAGPCSARTGSSGLRGAADEAWLPDADGQHRSLLSLHCMLTI